MPAHHIRPYLQVMSEVHAPTNHPSDAGNYEIRLQGRLDARWATWFDNLSLTNESDGTTVLYGHVADQAALHGLLQKVRDLGLPSLTVTHVNPERNLT
jgi:hypothetical protein